MKIILLSVILLTNLLFAASVEVELSPKDPVLGESYNVIFTVKTKDGDNPIINFDLINAEVLAREQTGISTRTTYINGKLTVERSITVNYEMTSAKPSFAYIRNISVEIDNEVIRHKTIRFKVYKEAKKLTDIFVRAEVDKNEVFLGQSVIVRYYLYNRVRVLSMDIKKFPTLDKFLKRFHQETTATERVQLESGVYERRILYSAQLYSNKVGISKIDPISISVGYASADSRNNNNPFSNFGFRSMQSRKKSLRSDPVEIKVIELPADIPSGFTGLIGEHKIEFKINKEKFLVNEPIEIALGITGPGALELFEEPNFFDSDLIESFDSTSDFIVNKDFTSTKNFKITYLARRGGVIPAKDVSFVIFDPKNLKFITKSIQIPEIKIAGTSISAKNNDSKVEIKSDDSKSFEKTKFNLDPVYKFKNTLIYNRINVLIIILVLSLFFVGSYLYRRISFSRTKEELNIYMKILKYGASYADFFELMQQMDNGSSIVENIKRSTLLDSEKEELLKKLNELDEAFKNDRKIKVKISRKIIFKIKEISERI